MTNLWNKEFNQKMNNAVLIFIGLVMAYVVIMTSFVLPKTIDEKHVFVLRVPDAGNIHVVYKDELYTVKTPIEGWNDEMSVFADGLMDDGVIVLKDFWVDHEDREIYPSEIWVDGEDAVSLILEKGPQQLAAYNQ